jgi:hypothetical protein
MQQTTMKFMRLLGLGLLVATISISSCQKDDKGTKKDDNTKTDDGTNPNPLDGKDYLLFQGVKVEFRNPAMGKLVAKGHGDTALEWYGNKSSSANDTVLIIRHIGFDEELNPIIPLKERKYGIEPFFSFSR